MRLISAGQTPETHSNARQIEHVFRIVTSLSLERVDQTDQMHLKAALSVLDCCGNTFSVDASESAGGADYDDAVDS